MNIFSIFSGSFFNTFQEKVLRVLSTREGKIVAIAVAIFGVLLAGGYAICRCRFTATRQEQNPVQEEDLENLVFLEVTEEELREKAEAKFGENRGSCLLYVNDVIGDGILDDPKTYLQNWRERKGNIRVENSPQDMAFDFFMTELTTGGEG